MEIITNEQAEILKNLLQVDIDAVEAYQQALKQIDDPSVYDNISKFCENHEAHIQKLMEILLEHRYEPAHRSKDFKGFVIKGFTIIRGLTGTPGTLKALQTNEALTNQYYTEAAVVDFPEKIKEVVRLHFEDDKRHLTYLNEVLEHKE